MPQERAHHEDSHRHAKPGAFHGAGAAFLALRVDHGDHQGSNEGAKKAERHVAHDRVSRPVHGCVGRKIFSNEQTFDKGPIEVIHKRRDNGGDSDSSVVH